MKQKKSHFTINKPWIANTLGVIIFISIISIVYLTVFNLGNIQNNVQAFFATTPQAKCEAFIEDDDSDTYCNKDGSERSHEQDKKKDCQTKAPYFQWRDGIYKKDGTCFRVRYQSKQACIDDGRQGSETVKPEQYDDIYIRVTTCKDDGTWTSRTFDPAYDEYKQRLEAQKYSTTCKDVTSYDYNWNNDMLCTRPDGTQFYTSYNDAQSY